jgi:hypothetical protein
MMDELTFQQTLRVQPPADPTYQPRLTAQPGLVAPVATPLITTMPQARPISFGRLAIAIAVVALGAGILVLAAGKQPAILPATSPSPSASAAATRLLPAVISDDIPNGVIETPIGPARWAHLTGDPETLPAPLWPIPGPDGLLWFQGGRILPIPCEGSSEPECPVRPGLWASADAISEQVERRLPIESEWATLTPLDGTWWLTTLGPTSLWRSTDAERWEPVDLGSLISPGPAGLDWEVRLGVPASSGGRTVIPVTYRALDAGRLLGYPDQGVLARPERDESGAYRVVVEGDGGGTDVGEVRIEETASGLRFSDAAGNTITVLDGVDLDFVDAWSANGAIVEHHVGRVEGAAVTPATLPGGLLFDQWGHDGVFLFGTDAGFHAYQPSANETIRTWRSGDGEAWTELDALGDAEGEPRGTWVESAQQLDSGRASVVIGDSERSWESTDGTTWQLTLVSPVGPNPWRLGDGWLHGADGEWWASVDGTAWDRVPELAAVMSKWDPDGVGGSGSKVNGNTLFNAVVEEEGTRQRDMWIVEFGKTSE